MWIPHQLLWLQLLLLLPSLRFPSILKLVGRILYLKSGLAHRQKKLKNLMTEQQLPPHWRQLTTKQGLLLLLLQPPPLQELKQVLLQLTMKQRLLLLLLLPPPTPLPLPELKQLLLQLTTKQRLLLSPELKQLLLHLTRKQKLLQLLPLTPSSLNLPVRSRSRRPTQHL